LKIKEKIILKIGKNLIILRAECRTCDGVSEVSELSSTKKKLLSMKHFELIVELREDLGKKASQKLRKENKIPCVLYGNGENLHFFVTENAVRKLVYTPEVMFVDLRIGDSMKYAVLKQIQFHPVSDKIIHIDFQEITESKPVSIHIPLKITGNSPGVRAGGKLKQNMRMIGVKGLMKDIPDFYTVSIDELKIGDSIKIKDLQSETLEFTDNKNSFVVSVLATRGASAAGQDATE